MAVLVSHVIDRVIARLNGPVLERRNQLAAGRTTGETTMTVTHLDDRGNNNATPGQVIEFPDGERSFVWASTTGLLTVTRGFLGTTAATRSANEILLIDPNYPRTDVLNILMEEINSWPRDIFKVVIQEIAWPSNTTTVDLTNALNKDIIRILKIDLEPVTLSNSEPHRRIRPHLLRHVDTADYTSGYALQLPDGLTFGQNRTVRVTYAEAYSVGTALAESQDLTETTPLEYGLNNALLQALQYGACWRLFSMREASRTDYTFQQQPRRAEEVPPTHIGQTASGFLMVRDRMLAAEANRLRAEYKWTSRA